MAISKPPSRFRNARRQPVAAREATVRHADDRSRTGAQLVCESLLAHGADLVFGYPGGAALTLYDQLVRYPIHHVLVRHEQSAAHAADGFARATGRVGVCISTSGPGATNLITGLATAHLDSVPLVAITGQVATSVLGTQAFQEVDIVSVAKPVTKAAFRALSAEELPEMLAAAFAEALSGRPGPVLVDLPKDVQAASVRLDRELPVGVPAGLQPDGDFAAATIKVGQLLESARRPVLIVGRGVALADGVEPLRSLAERLRLPVAHTLLGVGLLPDDHPLSLGMVGMHGTVAANLAVHDADLVIGVGCRFDDRVVMSRDGFAPGARVVHVDVDPAAFGRSGRVDLPVRGDARAFLELLDRLVPSPDSTSDAILPLSRESGDGPGMAAARADWLERIAAWRRGHASCGTTSDDGSLTVPLLLRALHDAARESGRPATVVADVGQHEMFAARHYGYDRPGSYFASGGLGTMGYGLPAAIGVQLARPDETVWAIVGDGGFQMSSPELATYVAEGLPIKIVVVNNGHLGMVRQWQEAFYGRNYAASALPDLSFARVAEAYGFLGLTCDDEAGVREAAARALAHDGPALVEARVLPEENVWPMVAPGECLGDVRCVEGRVRGD